MEKLYHNTFKENRLVHLKLGNLFKIGPADRASVLNSNEESTAHNDKMQDAANNEFNDSPIADSLEKIKSGATDVKDQTMSVIKDAVKAPFKLAAHLITKPIEWIGKPLVSATTGIAKSVVAVGTNVAGVAATAPRLAFDVARLGARVPLIVLDKLSVYAGKPSVLIRYIKEKVLSTIDDANAKIFEISGNTRGKIYSTLGVEQ